MPTSNPGASALSASTGFKNFANVKGYGATAPKGEENTVLKFVSSTDAKPAARPKEERRSSVFTYSVPVYE